MSVQCSLGCQCVVCALLPPWKWGIHHCGVWTGLLEGWARWSGFSEKNCSRWDYWDFVPYRKCFVVMHFSALLCTPVCIPVRMLARWFWCASMPKRGLRCYNGCPSQPLLFREQQTWWEIHSRERILCSSVWVNAVTHIALIWACHNRLLSLLLRHSVVVAPRQTPTWVRHPMCCFVNGWCSSILCWPTVGWKGLSGVGRYIPPEILSSNLVFPNLSFNLDRDICAVFISWDIIIIIGILLLYLHLFVKPFHFSRWEHVQWLPYLSVKVSLRVFQSTCALLFGMRTL